jgi:hypothetical protein
MNLIGEFIDVFKFKFEKLRINMKNGIENIIKYILYEKNFDNRFLILTKSPYSIIENRIYFNLKYRSKK